MSVVALEASCTCSKGLPAPTQIQREAPIPLPAALADESSSPLQGLPRDAALVAHVDVRRLLESPLWRENQALMRDDPEATRTLEALAGCSLDLPAFTTIDLAVDASGHEVAVSIRGDGVGAADRLRCVGDRLFDGDAGRWSIAEDAGALTLQLDGGAAIGRAVARDHLVVASKGWEPAVARRLRGEDPPPQGGTLGEALAAVRTDAPIWFAGKLPPLLGPTEHLRSVAGAIDLDRGLALELSLGMSKAEEVAELEADLTRRAANIRARLVRAGLPALAADRLQIDAIGTTLKVRAALEIAEIQAVRALLAADAGASTTTAQPDSPPATTTNAEVTPPRPGATATATDPAPPSAGR